MKSQPMGFQIIYPTSDSYSQCTKRKKKECTKSSCNSTTKANNPIKNEQNIKINNNNVFLHYYFFKIGQRILWWLKLCVILTGLRGTQIAGKQYFRVCLWGFLQKRLASQSVDWVKKMSSYQYRLASSNPLGGLPSFASRYESS